MTEREFQAWRQYAERRMLPSRRIELALAQLTMWIAWTMGGKTDLGLDDFLFDPKEEAVDVDAMKQALGFSPRNRKD